jgi:asparagine synthase (glutamine-hydrolysing)
MSGVCGIVRFDGGAVASSDIDRQTRAMGHRGPDGARSWVGPAVGLGALLMRVTDEDEFDEQPIRSEDRDLTFVCDARLDNREEIARLLGLNAADLARLPDSALIFAAFKAWGASCAERLIGDFLFAVWDGRTRQLTLVRDHMGQRYAFCHLGEGFFAFATERKGLWALPQVPRNLDVERALRRLASRTALGPRQIPEPDAREAAPAGCVVTIDADGLLTVRRYWSPHAAAEHEGRDEAYYTQAYREVLGEAVACRLRRLNRPASLMFAGGFDSTAIAGLAGEALRGSGRKLICVSSVLPKDAPPQPGNARKWVEACQRTLPHLDVRFVTQADPRTFDRIEASFQALDTAYSENRFIADTVMETAASAGARVIMDGNGGDYTLNPRTRGWFLDQLRAGRWGLFRREWEARRQFLKVSQFALFRHTLLLYGAPWLMRRWRRWRGGLGVGRVSVPVSPAIRRGIGARPLEFWTAKPLTDSMLRALRTQQSNLANGYGVAAARYGLEFTQPFHDKRVVELALAVPDWMLMKNGRERPLARAALHDIYPPEFAARADFNDDYQPDFVGMALQLRPRLLAEIERMEAAGKLSRYFDFPMMRRQLTQPQRRGGDRPAENACRVAIRGYLHARYIEWFTGANS